MRTTILIVLALALSALTTCVDSKPAAKATSITGDGKYELGKPIPLDDLKNLFGPFKDPQASTEKWSCYSYSQYNIKLKAVSTSVDTQLILETVSGKIESIIFNSYDIEQQLGSHEAYLSFIQEMRQALVDKYSPDILESDTVYLWDGSWNNKREELDGKKLVFRDKDGNVLELTAGGMLSFWLEYNSAFYRELRDAAIQNFMETLNQ